MDKELLCKPAYEQFCPAWRQSESFVKVPIKFKSVDECLNYFGLLNDGPDPSAKLCNAIENFIAKGVVLLCGYGWYKEGMYEHLLDGLNAVFADDMSIVAINSGNEDLWKKWYTVSGAFSMSMHQRYLEKGRETIKKCEEKICNMKVDPTDPTDPVVVMRNGLNKICEELAWMFIML